MIVVKPLIFLTGIGVVVSKSFTEKLIYNLDNTRTLFNKFIKDYEKIYNDENEKQVRFNVFKRNLIESNSLHLKHPHTTFGKFLQIF